jgi:hypothetical protein
MSKIGIILTAYGMIDYVDDCLRAWLAARTQRLNDHEFVIAAVSVPFAAFPDSADDGTVARLRGLLDSGEIDHLITEPIGIPETEARGLALTYLRTRDVDIVWQVDIDELYTERDISRILRYVDGQPYIAAFRLCLKNYVFDTRTYLADPFTPMRIHRTKVGPLESMGFWADNNVYYGKEGAPQTMRDDQMATVVIPQTCAWIRHITWQSDARAERKVRYQLARWNRCSFRWDETKGLVFDPAAPAPRTLTD